MRALLLLAGLLFSCLLFGQTTDTIAVPAFKDTYSNYVSQLESGQTDIDYKAFRESFIDSKQFLAATKKKLVYDSLKKAMSAAVRERSYASVMSYARQVLSLNYTCMLAHKLLQQTSKILGDTATAARYKAIEFGLLNSIVKNGDGKTCATGWPVIQIEEEYFILGMLGASDTSQTLDLSSGTCDRIDATVDGASRTYFFEISNIFKGYKKLGLK